MECVGKTGKIYLSYKKEFVLERGAGSQRGSILMAIIVVFSVVSGGVLYLYKGRDLAQKQLIKRNKDIKVHLVEEVMGQMAGFLLSNSLIVCKESSWADGAAAGTCRWNDKNEASSTTLYSPNDFSLINKGLNSKGKLRLEVSDAKGFFKDFVRDGLLTGKNTWLEFDLRKARDISVELGKMGEKSKKFNPDDHFVVVEGNIEHKFKGEKRGTRFTQILRRPQGIPKIQARNKGACIERCDVSLGENPYPACRSVHYRDLQSLIQIEADVINMGPGVIYDMSLNRFVRFGEQNTHLGGKKSEKKVIKVVSGDFIIPGEKRPFSDTFPCLRR